MTEVKLQINETPHDICNDYCRYTGKKLIFLVALITVIILSIGIAASSGSADVTLEDVYNSITAKIFPGNSESSWTADI